MRTITTCPKAATATHIATLAIAAANATGCRPRPTGLAPRPSWFILRSHSVKDEVFVNIDRQGRASLRAFRRLPFQAQTASDAYRAWGIFGTVAVDEEFRVIVLHLFQG